MNRGRATVIFLVVCTIVAVVMIIFGVLRVDSTPGARCARDYHIGSFEHRQCVRNVRAGIERAGR